MLVAIFALSVISCPPTARLSIAVEVVAVPAAIGGTRSLAADCGILAVRGTMAFAVFTTMALAAATGGEPIVSVSQTIETADSVPAVTVTVGALTDPTLAVPLPDLVKLPSPETSPWMVVA